MDKKRSLKAAAAVFASLSAAAAAGLVSLLILRRFAGDGVYAVSAPLLLPADLIFAAVLLLVLFPRKKAEIYSEESAEEEPPPYTSVTAEIPQIDADEYPELTKRRIHGEEELFPSRRPDIKEYLTRQKEQLINDSAEPPGGREENPELDAYLKVAPAEIIRTDSIYDNIPSQLPEGYAFPTEDEAPPGEDLPEEDSDEAELPPRPHSSGIAAKLCAICAAALAAVLLPASFCTVYREDGVTLRRFASKESLLFSEAEEYTASLKLSGELSLKLKAQSGTFVELLNSGAYITSPAYREKFKSPYSYAEHCDSVLRTAGAAKTVKSDSALADRRSLSEAEIKCLERILEK